MFRPSRWHVLTALLLAAFLALPGCSDDDPTEPPGGGGGDDTDGPPTTTQIQQSAQIPLPQGLVDSDSPEAQQIEAFVTQISQGMSAWIGLYAAPDKALADDEGPPWVYSWSIGEPPTVMTITWTIDETETHNTWEMVINGTDGENVYEDFVFYSSAVAKDGSDGYFRVREPENPTDDWVFEWAWGYQDDDYVMTWTSRDPGEEERFVFLVRPDGSGYMQTWAWDDVAEDWWLQYEFTWAASGMGGGYTEYDDEGNIVEQNDWGDDPGEPGDYPVPYVGEDEIVQLPPGLVAADDYGAQTVVNLASISGWLLDYFNAYGPPDDLDETVTGDAPPWTVVWEGDGFTVTLLIADGGVYYTWQLIYDGTIDGEVYDNDTVAVAQQNKDGSVGYFQIYDPNDGMEEPSMAWQWSTNGLGQFLQVINFWEGEDLVTISFVVNADGSGQVEAYQGEMLMFTAEWDAAGNGSYTDYSVEPPETGEWTAGVKAAGF